MRTSLTDIKNTEAYLQGKLNTQERLFFEARLLTSPLLRLNLQLQKQVYTLLQLYHRRQLKEEVALVQQRLFDSPDNAAFQQSILHLFNPPKA